MYQSWLQDQQDTHKLYKDYSIFLGSFFNAEMAQAVAKQEEPDFEASEEDFEKSTEVLLQQREAEFNKVRHRRRRKVIQEELMKDDD